MACQQLGRSLPLIFAFDEFVFKCSVAQDKTVLFVTFRRQCCTVKSYTEGVKVSEYGA